MKGQKIKVPQKVCCSLWDSRPEQLLDIYANINKSANAISKKYPKERRVNYFLYNLLLTICDKYWLVICHTHFPFFPDTMPDCVSASLAVVV